MSKHTPGPWEISNRIGRKNELGIIASAAPCIIAVMGNQKEWPVEAHANARLIKAAPDMLKALIDASLSLSALIDVIETGATEYHNELQRAKEDHQAAREAIAKATGE